VAELTDAVRRLDAGTYGVCEACGAAIPDERLEARPAARTCVSCAAQR
jgi:RNA polymerase-binding transcription factor DksA